MILFSLTLLFSLLYIPYTITSEKSIQPDDPTITQLLGSQYDCSKPNNLRQFSFTRVQKSTQAPSEIESARTSASVFIRDKAKKLLPFAVLQPFKTIECLVLKVHKAKRYRQDRMDWHTNSMPLP